MYARKIVTLTKAMHRVNRVGYGFVVRGKSCLVPEFSA